MAADALVIPDDALSGHLYVHGAGPVAFFAVYTGARVPPDLKDAEQVEDAQQRPVRAEVFAPGPFDDLRQEQWPAPHGVGGDGNLAGEELKERVERIIAGTPAWRRSLSGTGP
jgi:hypothetical protein